MSNENRNAAQPLGFGSSAELGLAPERAACMHRRYSVDKHEQTGRCMDCGAEGRIEFVVGDPVAAERERWNTLLFGPHLYRGECPTPDRDQIHWRDAKCPACRALGEWRA